MKEKIANLFNNAGIEIFFIIKKENKRLLKRMNSNELVVDSIKKTISKKYDDFLSRLDDLKDIKDAYDGSNSMYKLQKNLTDIFDFFVETNEKFDKKDRVDGYAIKLELDNEFLWIYQNIFPSAIIKNKNRVMLTYNSESNCQTINNDLMMFEQRIDAIIIDDVILIENYKVIEKKFNYKEIIKKISSEVIDKITSLNIIEDMDKVIAISEEDKITYSKKIMRAHNSPVLQLTREDIIESAKKSEAYKELIVNDKFELNTKKSAKHFVEMLNDQRLKSELTGIVYNAPVKSQILE